jgi:hypothetical protein
MYPNEDPVTRQVGGDDDDDDDMMMIHGDGGRDAVMRPTACTLMRTPSRGRSVMMMMMIMVMVVVTRT